MTSRTLTRNTQTVLNLFLGTMPDGKPCSPEDCTGSLFMNRISRLTGLPSGTLAPMLSGLVKRGWLEQTWEKPEEYLNTGRPRRRYYQLSEAGRTEAPSALAEAAQESLHHYMRQQGTSTPPAPAPAVPDTQTACAACSILSSSNNQWETVTEEADYTILLTAGTSLPGGVMLITNEHLLEAAAVEMSLPQYLSIQVSLHAAIRAVKETSAPAHSVHMSVSGPGEHPCWRIFTAHNGLEASLTPNQLFKLWKALTARLPS